MKNYLSITEALKILKEEKLNEMAPFFNNKTTEDKIYDTYLKYYPDSSWEGRERILNNAAAGSASYKYSFGSCDEEILKICKDDGFEFTGQYRTYESLIEGSKHVSYGDFLRFKIYYDNKKVYS